MTAGDTLAGASDNLRAWVDAAAGGGFPVPRRCDRWQPLRAGVVGLWEFDITEFWYANGWVQLTGRNETGKSSLMALTTLIPWLADTASSNIDTLGRSGKKFRYYVEPTGADGDRRTSEASTHRGWLWVEYGRLVDDEPRYFTTLLFAETRSAAADVKLSWCTVEGSARVRESIDLAPQRIVAAPKELDPPDWTVHPTATAYREHVARRLLGSTAARLESVGKMLKVTRTPKLGAQLEIAFVQQHLRAALPELNRAEVDALAGGWDQLDQIRGDLASTKEAADTLERFRRTGWLPWARAAVRHRADLAGSARTVLDNVTRRESEAREAVERCVAAQKATSQAATAAKQNADSARTAADQLQDSARYQDARDRLALLEQHRDRRTLLAARLRQDESDRDRAVAQECGQRADAARAAEGVEKRSAEADARRDAFVDTAGPLIDIPSEELDLTWTSQALIERRRSIDGALRRADDAAEADIEATGAEERAGQLRDQARRDAEAADAAWTAAEEARDVLGQAILSWTAGIEPRVSGDNVERWLSGLPATADATHRATLDDAIRADWFEPARSGLLIDQHQAQEQRSGAEAESSRIGAEIAELESAVTPSFPAPIGWARRERPPGSPAGAPLWALTDPRDGVSEAELVGLEAALAAASLLDAWVTPDGVFSAERDGHDLVVTPPPAASGTSLANVLRVADGDPDLGRVVAALLAGIALVPAGTASAGTSESAADPAGALMISPDGRWWSPGLSGRAGAQHDHPEWIGESARARRRRRRIEELNEQRTGWLAEAARAAANEAAASASLATLAGAMDRRPRDGELRAALALAAERDLVAGRSTPAADQAEAHARRLRTTADDLRAALARFCAEHRLPAGADGLQAMRTAVGDAVRLLERLGQGLELLDEARSVLEQAEHRFGQARTHRVSLDERVARTAGEHREADATVATLEATIDADDREILDELERLKRTEGDAARLHADLESDLRQLGEELGGARTLLAGTEEQREEARQSRDSAYAAFRRLLDRGLGSELDLTFGDTTAAGAERIRNQVAVVRRELSPPRWPADPAEQESMVSRLSGDLVKLASDETRIRLEASGRTLRIDHDEHGLPVVEVLVDSTGTPLGPRAASVRLREIHDELAASYSQRVQETLDELLGSTFLEHLRDQVGATQTLINQINQVLAKHPVVTTKTSLKIVLEPASASDAAMLEAVSGPSLANPDVAGLVRDRLRERVEEAKRLAETEGDEDWRNRLAHQLDYRGWFDVHLRKRIGSDGRWTPLTTQGFAEMSGGARAVILMLPLVATLAALYEDMAGAPRPLWLDEAFDGLDSLNREMVMDLFGSFDLDVLLAGPARLVNVRTVPAAAIYQVVRAPAPMPGVDLTLELWAGGDLQQVELPATLPSGSGGPSGTGGPVEGTLL